MRVLSNLQFIFLPIFASVRFSFNEIKDLSAPRSNYFGEKSKEKYLEDLVFRDLYNPVYKMHPKLGLCGPQMFTDLKPIGKGSFSTVYKAIHDPTGITVALKVLKHDQKIFSRIRLEECLQHKVSFPTIREHYCTFICQLGIVMVMEYVEGTTLAKYGKSNHPIPLENLKRWAAQLTAAVMALHLNSIVFVDISPQNIIVTNGGRDVKLIDFGLAADSSIVIPGHDDHLNGTPYYTSPENAESFLSGRSDINYARPSTDWYSLGVVLFETATQRLLYDFEALEKGALKKPQLSLRRLFANIRRGIQMIESDRVGREDLMDYIVAITKPDPNARLGTTEETYQAILDHPLFEGLDTLRKFIGID